MASEKIKIVQGDKVVFDIYVVDKHGRPVDLEDWDEFSVSIPYGESVLTITEEENDNDSVVALLEEPTVLGHLQVTLGSADTALLEKGIVDMQISLDNSDEPNKKSNILSKIVEVFEALAEAEEEEPAP